MSTTKNRVALSRWLIVVGVTLGSIAAVGCSGDDDDDAASDTTEAADDGAGATDDAGGAAGGAAVAYTVDAIQYDDVSAPAGGTIEIENTSGAPHTFTADDGAFDVSYGPDEAATVDVPAEPGEYAFHCSIHASMQATLTVE
jgi:plastocyanin